ncbi:general transcription factor IIF subunit 2 [Planococcus citri]|uniref:general transcription factor IIF subunit 2 n=1 Tax=Planococcus citri TaxID=170843 RepID=UPI0031F9A190
MSQHTDKELDVSNSSRGIWLVKVPKYIASKWEKAPSSIEVGKLKINRNANQKVQVSLNLSESMLCMDNDNQEAIPRNHKLDVTPVNRQTLGVFSQGPSGQRLEDSMLEPDKLILEGKIAQRLECHPYADSNYMKLKMESFKKAREPVRLLKTLDKVVVAYKPVSNHKHLKEYEEKKKAEGKRSRDDKNAVLDMLFKAFDKHQYYNIKDLVTITKQPVGYLKEILKEVCNHNMKNPHKNMWELKPEYRHYNKEEEKAAEPGAGPSTSS